MYKSLEELLLENAELLRKNKSSHKENESVSKREETSSDIFLMEDPEVYGNKEHDALKLIISSARKV